MKISCIMPTAQRRQFIPCAVACFLAQTYRDRELVIFDDGDVPIEDLLPADRRIRYYKRRTGGTRSIGALRNTLCDLASGELIAHWDDDDWSAPNRLEVQASALQEDGLAIGVLSSLAFIREQGEPGAWNYCASRANYGLGTSLLYKRALWYGQQFDETLDHGEDNEFIRPHRLSVLEGHMMNPAGPAAWEPTMIARVHGAQTSAKPVWADEFIPLPDSHFTALKGLLTCPSVSPS